MATGLTIGRAAERAGVGVETIRFYERRGLIKQPPRPRSGGFRFYGEEVVERIRFIRRAQEIGFSLREVTELLALRADPGADCSDVRKQAVIKREEVDHKIGQLQQIRMALDELIVSCPGGGALRACTIVDALTGHANTQASHSVPTRSGKMRSPRTTKGRGTSAVTFRVEGMHCDGCVQTIRFVLGREPGVRNVDVSLKNRLARVTFEPRVVDADRLASVIKQAGFHVAGHR